MSGAARKNRWRRPSKASPARRVNSARAVDLQHMVGCDRGVPGLRTDFSYRVYSSCKPDVQYIARLQVPNYSLGV